MALTDNGLPGWMLTANLSPPKTPEDHWSSEITARDVLVDELKPLSDSYLHKYWKLKQLLSILYAIQIVC